MFRNYLKTAFRNLTRNKIYSFINIVGLAIGVAVFIIITLFIQSELRYDKFNKKIDNIYRLDRDDWGILGTAYGPEVKSNFPEVKEFVRFTLNSHSNPIINFENSEKQLHIQNFGFADPQVFDIFTFNFIKGDPGKALNEPYAVVLTESTARKMFGKHNPVGKSFILDKEHTFKVTGVIEDLNRFHLNISAIGNIATVGKMNGWDNYLNKFGSWNHPTYLLLQDGVDIASLNKKISNHFEKIMQKKFNIQEELNFHLKPLADIYFDTETKHEINVNHGNIKFIYIFIAIAVFILVIAAINFINLTTAKAANRSKEVGLRKVVGGHRKQLIRQFLSESLLISLIAFVLAIGLVELLLPHFNDLLQGEISNNYYTQPFFWLIFVGGIIIVGIVSGLYPSFYLTKFSPVSVIKGEKTKGTSGSMFRRALTVFQFFISVVLIIGTLIIFAQINYMKNKDMGIDKEHQVHFSLTSQIRKKKKTFKDELLKNPNIKGITYSSQPAGRITWQERWEFNGEGKQFTYQPADPDYVKVMGLKIIKGEDLSWDKPSHQNRRAVLLNEEAVEWFGLEDPVGKIIHTNSRFWQDVEVVGILKDFHFNSMHKKIAPFVVAWDNRVYTANMKIAGNNIQSTLNYLKETWQNFEPAFPLEYHFLDQSLDRQYKDDERFGKLFTFFAVFAIIIACLGLYGLSLFSTQQRTKEIGIRKANGASVKDILSLFLKEFSLNVIIANLIAWPSAYFFMKNWLTNFPYRTNIEPWVFGVALIISLFIAILTVSYNTIKAANTNPAYTLRDE
jgi:putative ABC transport system permease protein